MGKAKRLGILGAVIAVMALMVGAVSPTLGSSQGAASTSSDKQQTIRVSLDDGVDPASLSTKQTQARLQRLQDRSRALLHALR